MPDDDGAGRRHSARKLNLDAFIRQAGEYEDWDSGWDKLNRLTNELQLTHSYPVRRVKEIMAWVQSGEYDRIAGGQYLTRDQQADPRKEANDAVEFYKAALRQDPQGHGRERRVGRGGQGAATRSRTRPRSSRMDKSARNKRGV